MLIDRGADPSSLSGSQLVACDLDVVPTDEQLTDIPEGHKLRKNYYNAIEKRCSFYKEELMASCWHPLRVQRMLDMDYDPTI